MPRDMSDVKLEERILSGGKDAAELPVRHRKAPRKKEVSYLHVSLLRSPDLTNVPETLLLLRSLVLEKKSCTGKTLALYFEGVCKKCVVWWSTD